MRRILFVAAVLLGRIASGQSLTTVQDIIVLPNGQMPNGTITLSWQSFLNAAHQQVPAGTNLVVPVTNGSFSVNLTPTDTSLPYGVCYQVATALTGMPQSVSSWYVPTSATPVNLNTVQSLSRCAPQVAANVALAQLTNSGANLGQCIVWTSSTTGAYWKPGSCGSGGGTPGGNNGQIQINSVGVFGGFTPGGDVRFSNPNFTVVSTNGVAFAPSATANALNASNISSGTLGVAVGGTGAGTFTAGSIPFIGSGGVYMQDNGKLNWFDAGGQLNIVSAGASPGIYLLGGTGNSGYIDIDNKDGTRESAITFLTGGVAKWQTGLDASNNFFGYDSVRSRDFLQVVAGDGNILIQPTGGSTLFGDITYSGSSYKIDVQSSGASGTLRVFDQTATTGTTNVLIQSGAGQSSTSLLEYTNNSGTLLGGASPSGETYVTDGSGHFIAQFNATYGAAVNNTHFYAFSSSNQSYGPPDTCTYRNAAGVLEIDNCTSGTYRDLILRNIDIASVTGSTQCLHVNTLGQVSGTGFDCGGGGGSGTVTSVVITPTSGQLTGSGTCTITTSGTCTLGLATTAVTANTYTNGTFTVDAYGRLTGASNGNVMTVAGTSLDISASGTCGSTSSGTCTLDLISTAVTPGSYTAANLTVDAKGRITSASNGTTSGSVTSVGLSLPGGVFSISGSPVTTSGTLTGSFQTQATNTVFAGPSSGSSATPTFRGLVAADLPLATTGAFGAVKPDGTTITISAGVISSTGGTGNAGATVQYTSSSGIITSCPSSSAGTVVLFEPTSGAALPGGANTIALFNCTGSSTKSSKISLQFIQVASGTLATVTVSGMGGTWDACTLSQVFNSRTTCTYDWDGTTGALYAPPTSNGGVGFGSLQSNPFSSTTPASGTVGTYFDSSLLAPRAKNSAGNYFAYAAELPSGSVRVAGGAAGPDTALSLTTSGSSGPATLSGGTLNIPQYTGGSGGSSSYSCYVTGVSLSTTPTSLSQCTFSGVTLGANQCLHIESMTLATSTQQLNISVGSTVVSQPINLASNYVQAETSLLCNNASQTAQTLLPIYGNYIPSANYANQGTGGSTLFLQDLKSPFPYAAGSITWTGAQTITVSYQSVVGTATGATMALKIF